MIFEKQPREPLFSIHNHSDGHIALYLEEQDAVKDLVQDVVGAYELDEMLKVYRYDGLAAGIRCDAIIGKELVINGGTYIYNGNLYLTGDINKGTFNASSGTWTQQKNLYNIIKS